MSELPEADDVGGDAHETIGAGKRQGLEDDGVHDGKHGRVRADAERERRDRYGVKAPCLRSERSANRRSSSIGAAMNQESLQKKWRDAEW